LMQKSFIITLLLPALIYVIFNKKYLFTIKYIILIIGIIFSLSIIANPDEEDIQSNTNIDEQEINQLDSNNVLIENTSEESKFYKLYRIYIGLKNRVIVVPGEIVSEWFEAVPSEKPFLNGLGYRFVAKLRGKEHVNYSDDLYPIIRPQYAERGLTGTVNTASFMYDYVNFGKIGLIISGFILSILFLFIESIFKSEFVFKLSLNLFHILILSSTALTTTLFSGGWFILIFLFFVFKKNLVLKND